jgi:CubicO group peptidase (beta-lactamase class C family)
MMLVDEGRLRLEDPIAKHLPAFAALTDPAGRPAGITLAQALTHTSGLGDIPRAEAQRARSLEALLAACLEQPLRFSPGSRWAYCQTGINAAARVVEAVSGERFQDFLDKRLFAPLGMRDTTFFPDAAHRARLATTYRLGRDGKPLEADRPGLDVEAGERVALANGGLFSTGPDYARFARMLLAGGTLDGRRYLSAEAVRTLAADHTGPLAAGFVPGSCWGIATAVVREPQGVTATLSPGTFGHGGAFGTQAWIDPVRGVAQILLFQRSDIGNSDGSPMRRQFHEAVARSLGWTLRAP